MGRQKKFPIIDQLSDKAKIKITNQVKKLHPVLEPLTISLANLDFIHHIRIKPEEIQASNELTPGRINIPITKMDHPTATGVHLTNHEDLKDVQFYEMKSTLA